MQLYTADSHFNHQFVLTKRPWYASMEAMNKDLTRKLAWATREPRLRVAHCGDVSMNFRKFVDEQVFTPSAMAGGFEHVGTNTENGFGLTFYPENHICVVGNHDNIKGVRTRAYLNSFGTIVGSIRTWQDNCIRISDLLDGKVVSVLVSHAPQKDLYGADFNVHGHIHDDIRQEVPHHPEYSWTYDSPVHFNAGVDLHEGCPVNLEQLRASHLLRYPRVLAVAG